MALDDQLEIEEPADAVMNELVGPLSETSQEIGGFIWQIIASNLPRDLHWQFLALESLLVHARSAKRKFIFLRRVYRY